MADTKREIERKYEADAEARATGETPLPDLTRVAGVSSVPDKGVAELDAVYYDTHDLRLAADSITLRRRTGGDDAGWHLKLPVSPDVRDEIRAPLADAIPRSLAGLIRSRTRDDLVVPVVRLLSSRDVRHLLDARGELLAEVSVDSVTAERLDGDGGTARWTEIEVELADGGDPAFLDAVEKRLRKAGVRRASSASKLARALADTAPGPKPEKEKKQRKTAPDTAGDHVLAYLREQVDAIVAYDPAVRRDLPDSVHQLRVATRRLRSALRTYKKVLDRTVTDPIAEELKWLAGELGVDRDHEVLNDRLQTRIAALPRPLLLGPVRGRLRSVSRRTGSRRKSIAVLDSRRHLDLLTTLHALLADPPLLPAAARPAAKLIPKAVLRDYARLAARVEHALSVPPGHDRDLAMHEARKAAKRARYAAEAACPALGKPAKRFAKRMKAVQTVLGDHQDSVVARDALRNLAVQAHAAGETAFTWGLMYGQEEADAAARERELPEVWERASRQELRADLRAV
ncbi:CYTH and CHAD domain-containing protein [Streptomyces sp. ISL-98]|uniref:CYTH and CHAD domain-containing protein n=1 Tax=Streptomyces sp. ISL-98 TaxID=2819192 RepID=UPI001BE93AE8|nr:CYTH and CHAD domain-containing protein [Streptomyces sp. ISL-98]MBT2505208.1 CYTH and CHAD domain-containing protein [Streptomyces sp. ISL-98]